MFISLRSKLILVMSLVVAMATGTTSWITQDYVERTYERRFVADFKAQVRAFSGQQLDRLERVREHCQHAVDSRVLIDALASEEKSRIRGAVQGVTNGVQDFILSGGAPSAGGPAGFLTLDGTATGATGTASAGGLGFGIPMGATGGTGAPGGGIVGGFGYGKKKLGDAATPAGRASRMLSDPPVGVLDASGDLINAGDSRLGLVAGFMRGRGRRPEDARTLLKRLADRAGSEQEVTYREDPNGRVWEMIVTPIIDKTSKHVLGALIVGVPMPDLRELELQTFSQRVNGGPKEDVDGIASGLWIEGHLHTQTIPGPVRDEVAEAVGARIGDARDEDHFHDIRVVLRHEGRSVPHKVIFRVLNPDSPFSPVAQVCLYSMAGEDAEVDAVRQRIISIGCLALAGALVLILLLTHRLTQPIRALFSATESVRRGEYDVSVPVTTHDEIGALAASFNDMTAGLRLNKKYQRVLAQVADREVAERLMHNESALGGELRDVTVLFCDIRGFTTLTSRMPPDEVIAMLNEHMTAMTGIVHELGGVVDKFVGDMVMALFGAPTTRGYDALRATRCALRMVLERDRLNGESQWPLQVGIGVASGRVIAGCMGSPERLDYTVLGERVNLAARLCSQASEGEVLLDDATLHHVKSAVTAEALAPMTLKGFAQPVIAHRITEMEDMALEVNEDAPAKAAGPPQ